MPRPFSSSDAQWMAHALALARRGMAVTSPNPMVGAVLVRNQRVVGEGFHVYDRKLHAEIVALEAAGAAARRATLYVNLEPCCTTGRTGPCTRALIDAGIARVVAAMPDPNPAVSGRGFKQLRAAGIEVEILASSSATHAASSAASPSASDDARRLNEAFALWIVAHRPLVTLKSAMTLDGHLVLPESSGKNRHRWITSAESRAEVHRLRHASDAILTGIGTVIADDPLLTDRTGTPRRRPLLRVILDSHLRIGPQSKLARSAQKDLLVFTTASESGARAKALRALGVEIVRVRPSAHGRPDLRAVLAELGRRNILSVLLEAGATLNQAALDAAVVDKVFLFYAPKLAGASSPAPPSRNHRQSHSGPARLHELTRVRTERFGPDFAVEGYLRDVYAR